MYNEKGPFDDLIANAIAFVLLCLAIWLLIIVMRAVF